MVKNGFCNLCKKLHQTEKSDVHFYKDLEFHWLTENQFKINIIGILMIKYIFAWSNVSCSANVFINIHAFIHSIIHHIFINSANVDQMYYDKLVSQVEASLSTELL